MTTVTPEEPSCVPTPPPAKRKWKSISLWAIDHLQTVQLEGNNKSVLWTLLKHHNDRTGQCNPSLDRIAACSGWCKNTVRKALKRLEERGLIAGEQPAANQTKQWHIDFAAIEALPPACPPKKAANNHSKPLQGWKSCSRPEGLKPKKSPTPPAPSTPAEPEPAVVTPVTSPLDPLVTQRINAQRQANGKRQPINLQELQSEARRAGITVAQAADWILAKPTRNFFRADYCQPEVPPDCPSTPKPQRDPVLVQLERDAETATRPSAEIRAQMQRIMAQNPVMTSNSVLLKPNASISMGAGPNTDWAHKIVARYTQGEAVSYAAISNAAHALGLSMADLKARRGG